jgi:hypothetical protein
MIDYTADKSKNPTCKNHISVKKGHIDTHANSTGLTVLHADEDVIGLVSKDITSMTNWVTSKWTILS